jgi:hypothetical protein
MECRDHQTHPTNSKGRSRLVLILCHTSGAIHTIPVARRDNVSPQREGRNGKKMLLLRSCARTEFSSWLFPHVAPHRRETSDVRSRARLSQDWRLSSSLSSILYAPCQRTRAGSRFALSRKTLKTPLLRSIFTLGMHRIFEEKCTTCKKIDVL